MGVRKLPLVIPRRVLVAIRNELLLLCGLLAHRLEAFAAELAGRTARCWPFGAANGASARSLVVSGYPLQRIILVVSLVICFMLSDWSRDE